MHRLQFTGTAPRHRVHPSIHPSVHLSIHFRPSIISPLSSKQPKVIITPLRSNKNFRAQTKPTFDHQSFSSSFNRVIRYYVDILFLFDAKARKEAHRIGNPNSNNNIHESIKSRYFKQKDSIQSAQKDTRATIYEYRSIHSTIFTNFYKKSIFFFRNNTRHEETTQHRFVILFKRRRKKKNIVILYRIDAFQFSSLAPISERKVDETEKRERRQRSRGERRGEKPFSNRSDYFQIANTGEEGGGESISAGSESRQTTDRTSNPISHHTTSCIWSTGGGGDVTWQYGETHTRLKASISRTKQIPRQIGRFSLRTAGLPTFSIRPHSVRGIR